MRLDRDCSSRKVDRYWFRILWRRVGIRFTNDQQHPRVLVVDDEHLELDLFRRVLEGDSFAVWTADSYDAAVKMFQEHKGECDLLIVDVSLPGRNGVELAMDLLPAKPSLKVLFISGWVGGGVLGSYGISTDAPHFLRKSFSPETLVNRVKEILNSDQPSPLPKKRNDRKAASNSE